MKEKLRVIGSGGMKLTLCCETSGSDVTAENIEFSTVDGSCSLKLGPDGCDAEKTIDVLLELSQMLSEAIDQIQRRTGDRDVEYHWEGE